MGLPPCTIPKSEMHEYTQMQVRTTVAMDTEQYGKQMQDCA